MARQPQSMRTAEAVARAGHDGDASVKADCHDVRPRAVLSCPGVTRLRDRSPFGEAKARAFMKEPTVFDQ